MGTYRQMAASLMAECIDGLEPVGLIPVCALTRLEGNRVAPNVHEELVGGAADACRARGVCLAGGDTEADDAIFALGRGRFSVFAVGRRDHGGGSVAREMAFGGATAEPANPVWVLYRDRAGKDRAARAIAPPADLSSAEMLDLVAELPNGRETMARVPRDDRARPHSWRPKGGR